MRLTLFKTLLQQGLITEQEYKGVEVQRSAISLFVELRGMLYLGITLFSAATGILIYKHIETIGHDVLVICIALLCAACFVYCIRKGDPYSNGKSHRTGFWFDYILMLGALLLLTFIGYIQFQYDFFGHRWGLAVFTPMVLLFVSAYYFDHTGVLGLAITNLAAWVGINATPSRILRENDFDSERTIYAALLLGIFLLSLSYFSVYKKIKSHFSFTYKNFGAHILFIALLAALIHFEASYVVPFTALAVTAFLFFRMAVNDRSFYFLVITALYAWIGLSYVMVEMGTAINGDMGGIYFIFIYFILSGIGFIRFLMHYNKLLKQHANL